MTERSKSGRLSIAVLDVRTPQAGRPWPNPATTCDEGFDRAVSIDDRISTWMSADEVIDALMLEFGDDGEFWPLALPSSSVRH